MEIGERILDADRVFVALGKYGRYQIQAFIATNAAYIFLAFQIMQGAFINDVPQFYCTNENVSSPFNATNQSQCYSDNYGTACGTNGSYYKYNLEYGTTIATEWDLVCNKEFYASFAGSLFMIGITVGSAGITQLSDIFGRRWVYLISTWLLFITSFCQSFVQNYAGFAVFRFLAGIFYSGTCMVGWVISCENLVINMRCALSVVNGLFWSVGFILLGGIAYFVRSWRILSICLSLPILLTASFYWLVPETLHWYIAMGKQKEAHDWIKRASACNKTKVNVEECYIMPDEEKIMPVSKSKKTLLDILKSRLLCPQFLVMCYLWLVDSFLYFGLSLVSTQLSGNRYANFILSGLVEIPSWFVAAYFMEKLGRNITSVVFHLLAGLLLLSLTFIPETTSSGTNLIPLIVTVSLVAKCTISVTFMSIFLYVAEIVPTTVRSVAIGWCSVASHGGSILAPYVGLLNHISPVIVPILFGTMALIASPLTLVIPESKGYDLPEDMCDVRPSKCQSLLCPCVLPKISSKKKSVNFD